jgi:phage-related minor tail protein
VQSSGIFSAIGDWFSGLFASAKGNVFSGGELMRFASGGAFTNRVVGGPTLFPMGVMGEAGPEAIMPLARDGSGRLGVRGASGGVTVIVNNNAPGTVAKANATQGEGGQRMIEIIVEQVEGKVWGNVARGAGPGPSVLSHTYGLNRVAGSSPGLSMGSRCFRPPPAAKILDSPFRLSVPDPA